MELQVLKDRVFDCSKRFDQAVDDVRRGRRKVEDAQRTYDDVHKKHATLLMRRDQWSKEEASMFVDLTAGEISSRQELATVRESLQEAETLASTCQQDYMDAIRKRYHEEQMWQDKWRVLGTYGTWSLIVLNSIVFLGGQFFHQRREVRRLKAIEELINEKFDSTTIAVAAPAVAAEGMTEPHNEGSKESNNQRGVVGQTATTQSNGSTGSMGNEEEQEKKRVENKEMKERSGRQDDHQNESKDTAADETAAFEKHRTDTGKGGMTDTDDDKDNDNDNDKEWWKRFQGRIVVLYHNIRDGEINPKSIPIRDAVEAVHWPSAAVGATLTATAGLVFVVLFSKKQ